jgi:hypothetical protein
MRSIVAQCIVGWGGSRKDDLNVQVATPSPAVLFFSWIPLKMLGSMVPQSHWFIAHATRQTSVICHVHSPMSR